jgi:branched-chain amino acid transport system permease protein
MLHFFASVVRLVNGEQEIGRSGGFWVGALAVVVGLVVLPAFVSAYAVIWGFAGILSLGQSAFLGLAGYAYGVVGINLSQSGTTYLALVAGLLVPTLFAALLSYVMFYARVKGVYVAIMMLVVTAFELFVHPFDGLSGIRLMPLLFETFLNQTAGPQWRIGIASLGGNNGLGRFSGAIHEPPSLSLGLGSWIIEFPGQSVAFYYLEVALLIAVYLCLRVLVNSRFGLILAAIREDAARVESFGYDIRALQLIVFCIGATLAALSGILYVSWGNFITPSVFGVTNNILPVIWVAVGGRRSLTATVISTVVLTWLSQRFAIQGEYAFVVMGALLVVVMMLRPEGIVTAFGKRKMLPSNLSVEGSNAGR